MRASPPISRPTSLSRRSTPSPSTRKGRRRPSAAQLEDIIDFELGLYTAQSFDNAAESLRADGADGGPRYLATVLSATYYPGINDALGADPDGVPFNPGAMQLFAAWAAAGKPRAIRKRCVASRRAADIAAGEALFDSAPVHISNVRGLNDNPALGKPEYFCRHLYYLSRYAERGRPLLPAAARYRHRP